MKKINSKLLLLLLPCLLLVASCFKPNANDLETRCEAKSETVVETSNAFLSNMNSETCQDYKDALLDMVNNCEGWANYNASYQQSIDDWDCSDFDN